MTGRKTASTEGRLQVLTVFRELPAACGSLRGQGSCGRCSGGSGSGGRRAARIARCTSSRWRFPGTRSGVRLTDASDVGVTIQGVAFRHLLFERVLSYSRWTYVSLALSETFEALVAGLQGALWTPVGCRPVADQRVVDEPPQRGGVHPVRLDRRLDLAVDEGAEPRLEQLERLADPFVIGCRHVVRNAVRRPSCPRQPALRPLAPLVARDLHTGPPWYGSVGYRLVAPLTGPERRHPDHPAHLAHVRLSERR